VGHIARIGDMRNAYTILVGKSEGKRPVGVHRHTWEDIIRMNLRETGWEGADWIHLSRDRDWWQAVVKTGMSLRAP